MKKAASEETRPSPRRRTIPTGGRGHKRPVVGLDVLRDLMLGGRHSRRTVARMGVSLPTADRWLGEIARKVPWIRKVREGQTTWYEWRPRKSQDWMKYDA